MTENEVVAWLRLQRISGIGPVNACKLVAHFKEVQVIFKQSYKDLVDLHGVGPKTASSLLNPKFQKEAEEQYLKARSLGIRCLTLSHKAYPSLLKECTDAPLVLFQKGSLECLNKRMVSVVGTRNMTEYGRQFCDYFLEEIKAYNPVIVSGLAYGVDVYVQRRAVQMGFQTVSCLGHGLDRLYPRAHVKYSAEILADGAMLSEFWLGTPPQPMHFVRRNRIIAGLSPATVVVESGLKGGSLITADFSFHYNREVFAVPGRLQDTFSAGCNQLIQQQKAHPFQSVSTMARALNWTPEEITPAGSRDLIRGEPDLDLCEEELRIFHFLTQNGVKFLDEISISCALTIQETASLLFTLEMKQIVRPLPGKRFEIWRRFTN